MERKVSYFIVLVLICALFAGCNSEPVSAELRTVSLVVSKDSSDSSYSYLVTVNTEKRSISSERSEWIAEGEDKAVFNDIPYGECTVSVRAYADMNSESEKESSEIVDVSDSSVRDGVAFYSIALMEAEPLTFDDIVSVSFFDADGTTPVAVDDKGRYVFSQVVGPEGHYIYSQIDKKASDVSLKWSIGYSSSGYSDSSAAAAINMTELTTSDWRVNESYKVINGGATSKTETHVMMNLRDDSDGVGYLMRLTAVSGGVSYSRDYIILCQNDPYSPLVYTKPGEMREVTLHDNRLGDDITARFMNIQAHSGGKDASKSQTAWMLFADASHDLCYYVADNTASRNDFVDYDKYQANEDASRFGFEWGYCDTSYSVYNNYNAMTSKSINKGIMYRTQGKNTILNVFRSSEGSRNNNIWTALTDFRDRFAAGSDRFCIPNHKAMLYVTKYFREYIRDNEDAEDLSYFGISSNKCEWYWVCDQDNNGNGLANDILIGYYPVDNVPDVKEYARIYSFNVGDSSEPALGVKIRVTVKDNIYTRARLVFELPVFDVIGTPPIA